MSEKMPQRHKDTNSPAYSVLTFSWPLYIVAFLEKTKEPNEQGRLWSNVLEYSLGVHEGWLRLYDRDGNLVPTDGEARQAAGRRRWPGGAKSWRD
jgi:hypothetical protein